MGFEISVRQDFAAAHRLNDYEGNCRNIHGHTWRVEVSISGKQLDKSGMLIDFRDLKLLLSNVLKRFDHGFLNEISPFDRINPTAENLAVYIYNEVQKKLAEHKVENVRVWESENACASFRGGEA